MIHQWLVTWWVQSLECVIFEIFGEKWDFFRILHNFKWWNQVFSLFYQIYLKEKLLLKILPEVGVELVSVQNYLLVLIVSMTTCLHLLNFTINVDAFLSNNLLLFKAIKKSLIDIRKSNKSPFNWLGETTVLQKSMNYMMTRCY